MKGWLQVELATSRMGVVDNFVCATYAPGSVQMLRAAK